MMLKDKVAVVTGAARGIGREIAILMARHGARVVVNDYGGAADGSGAARTPADDVVNEIKAAGGPGRRELRVRRDDGAAGRASSRRRSTTSAAWTSSSTTPASCATA